MPTTIAKWTLGLLTCCRRCLRSRERGGGLGQSFAALHCTHKDQSSGVRIMALWNRNFIWPQGCSGCGDYRVPANAAANSWQACSCRPFSLLHSVLDACHPGEMALVQMVSDDLNKGPQLVVRFPYCCLIQVSGSSRNKHLLPLTITKLDCSRHRAA